MDTLPEEISLTFPDGTTLKVLLTRYLSAKLSQLQKFGYAELTLDELTAEFQNYWNTKTAETAVQMLIEQDLK